MQRENTRRLLRNIVVVAAVVVAVFLIFYIIRSLFFPNSSTQQSAVLNPILNTSSERGVKMTVRGPIVGADTAHSYEIDITPSSRSVTLYQGYDGTVQDKNVYSNSPAAYEQLVYALNKADMTKSRTVSDTDTRGVCATGRLYTFALENDTDIESSLWTSSCGGNQKGTLNAKVIPLLNLFDAQIPDVSHYTSGLNY